MHGYKDNYLSTSQALEVCRTRKLHMTCQPICYFTRDVLALKGIKSRPVHYITADIPNNFSDGHCMLEVWFNDQWVLVDMTTRMIFKKDGQLISAEEFLYPDFNEIEMIKFSNAPVFAYGDLIYNGIDLTDWYGETFLNEENLKIWYARICQTIH